MICKIVLSFVISCFFFSCTVNKIYKRTFFSEKELVTFIKEDFKKCDCNTKDSVYYLPPITSKVLSDTTIILFASRNPNYQPCGEVEYYYSRKQLKIIKILQGQ